MTKAATLATAVSTGILADGTLNSSEVTTALGFTPEKWKEVAVGYLPQPWTWQQINAQQALIAQSS